MSLYKLAAGLVALALSAAVVTALAGAGPDVEAGRSPDAAATASAEPNAAAAPGAKADRAPSAVAAERPVVRPAKLKPDVATAKWACPQEPWPYGCQWREPPVRKKVIRGSRPS